MIIDIFGLGPYISITELLTESINELGIFCIHFFFLLILTLFFKRLSFNWLALLLPIIQIIYVWSVSIKSEFVISFSLAFIITALVKLLELLPLNILDYSFLFSVMLFPSRLFNSTSALLGSLWIFWILFCVIYTTVKIGIHKLKGSHFICYFLFIILSLAMYSFNLSAVFLYPVFAGLFESSALGIICTIILIAIIIFLITFFVKNKFYCHIVRLNSLGKKYSKIECYFFEFSIIILALVSLFFLPFSILQLHNILIMLFIPCLCLALLCAQMPFIILLFRTAFYKDSVSFYEWKKDNITSYYNELDRNINLMKEIRHDIKNIFFTMGNFVDQSNDNEMKDFFWKKIYPYSVETINQSELLSKIYQIPDEPLRAFFNLKISQALNMKVSIDLQINIIPNKFQTGIDIIDLTRILGILIDNAIEETVKISDGIVSIKINNDNTSCSYIIKNTITEKTKKQGIFAGNTSKGEGRGKGLKIVNQLLEQYNNIVLNSFVKNSTYVQSLNIFIDKL